MRDAFQACGGVGVGFFFWRCFLKRNIGRTTLPISEKPQTIRVARNQVLKPSMMMPSVMRLVISRPKKVVTRAVPPMRNVALVSAIFTMSGLRTAVVIEKIRTAVRKEMPVIENPSRMSEATKRPSAFARSASINLKNKITMPFDKF